MEDTTNPPNLPCAMPNEVRSDQGPPARVEVIDLALEPIPSDVPAGVDPLAVIIAAKIQQVETESGAWPFLYHSIAAVDHKIVLVFRKQ